MTEQTANTKFKNAYSDKDINSKKVVDVITEALLSKKGKDITILNVSGLTTLTDYFVICHGTSDVQIKALSHAVEDDVREKTGEKIWKKEGTETRSWIILDFVNIVVHIMSKEKRDFYEIEQMWNDAKITSVENDS